MVTPIFNTITSSICQFEIAPVLPSASINTIPLVGVWNPAIINTSVVGPTTYTFVPNSGQCVSSVPYQVIITVTPSIVSNFAPINPICSGDTPPLLSNTAPNGVVGTWSPSVISNVNSGSYEFTPSATGCVAKQILQVTVIPQIVPNFPNLSLCKGDTSVVLNTTSPNGITGTWLPSVINPNVNGNYVFTPHPFQCASNQTISITLHQSLLQSVDYELSDAFSENQTITIITVPAGNYLYQLDNGTTQTIPVFQYVSPGLHQVTITDINGCNTMLQIKNIRVVNYPHFFTPNGDGTNDYWNISGLTISNKAYIYIFDRFGKLIKQLKPMEQGWNGIYNGRLMPSTDYWFTIEYVEDNVPKQFSSHFALKR